MNKLNFLAAIVFCFTISCSSPNQPDNSDKPISQKVITNDTSGLTPYKPDKIRWLIK